MNTTVIIEDKNVLKKEIRSLLKQKNAVLLAHYYQRPEIQEIADIVGDSLELSRKAAETDAAIILFAGVHFMAETAKILNPTKKVLLPDLEAGCSLAESCPPEIFRNLRNALTTYKVVSYINCSAEIKAMSDYICTSSNALKIINSIPADTNILFAPDKNLGRYLIAQTGRDMLLWDGACVVHEAFSMDKLLELWKQYPDAELVAHPESEAHILKVATFVGSTSAMLKHVRNSNKKRFIIATEAGILHRMQKEVEGKELIPAPADEDNTCACSECAFMKLNTLEKIRDCLLSESPEIILEESLRLKALKPLECMLSIS